MLINQRRAIIAVLLLMGSGSVACNRNLQHQSSVQQPSPTPPNLTPIAEPSVIIGKPYPGVGVVKLINKKEGWIEIDHEPIEGLMPAMVMEWHVEKGSMLNKVKVGDKVKFTVVETGKGEVLTTLERITE
jgi:Cu/Ag efflux protein CusF